MSIKLKGSSDGSVSFDAPADTSPSGSDITLTLPTSAGSANQFLKNSGIAGELEYSSMVEDSSGNLGLGGITSPTWASDGGIHLGDDYGIGFGDGGSGRPDFQLITAGDGRLDLRCGFGSDDADISIDSTGALGIGTSSIARGPLHINSSTTDTYFHVTNSSTGSSASDGFTLHQSGNDTLLNNRETANMRFYTANQERVRISDSGRLGVGIISPEVRFHPSSTNNDHLSFFDARHSSYTNKIQVHRCGTNASSAYNFINCESGCFGGTFDNEFTLRGDGNAYADGSWNGGGADYAEYFEWSDGNTSSEDRRGISVVLDGNKIREAVNGEEPIGIISGNPSVVGDAAWNHWNGKYVRDDYGSYVLNENGHRQVTAEYNSETEYTPREERPEWSCVGLMGKLRIRKGQVTGARWIKMRDVSDTVEEWLVR